MPFPNNHKFTATLDHNKPDLDEWLGNFDARIIGLSDRLLGAVEINDPALLALINQRLKEIKRC